MAKIYSGTISTVTTTKISQLIKRHDDLDTRGTICVGGTLGTGTLAVVISTDGGTTWLPLTNNGTAISIAALGCVNYTVNGCGSHNDDKIVLGLTSAGAAFTFNVTVYDNR